VWGPASNLRRLAGLVRQLPPEGALSLALSPNVSLRSSWGLGDELTAQVVEQLSYLGHLLHVQGFKEPHPEPRRVPRPWDDEAKPEPKRRTATADEMREWFGGGAVRFVPPGP